MNLRVKTVNGTALLTAAAATVIIMLFGILGKVPLWLCITACAVMFFLVFSLSRYFLRKYVLDRIKPLFQLVFSKDLSTSRLSEELRRTANDDAVDDLQEALDNMIALGDTEMERLKQKEQERTEFLTAVFHELRTPIFNIEGYTQTLLDGGLDDPEVNRKFLERTIRSIERLSALVEDVEKISRYESGGRVMYQDTFDIVDLVYEVIDVNIIRSRDNEVTVTVDKGSLGRTRSIMVYADRLRISQVVDRLVVNGIIYGKRGGTVTISFVDMYDKILVEIADSGIGIPPKDIPHIFEKFYRVERSRSRESGGSGLGLSGAKGIIDAHGESITVRSELNKGTTFSFTLSKAKAKQSRSSKTVDGITA